MCSKLGFSKGHDISLQDLSHSSSAQQPSKTGKHGTVRTTQRTHGVSTYKLTALPKQVQKHAEHAESYTDHVATADHASAKQRASYQVTEHAPTHKGTKQRVPQEPNFRCERSSGRWPKSQKSCKPCRRPRPFLGEGLWLYTRYSGGLPQPG